MGFPVLPTFKEIKKFKWTDMHKKIGRIIVYEPTDSDIQEGMLKTQVWFVTEDGTMYLLAEQ